ncbi:MAG: 16S rRNA (uracil(1498)-N(3))-methyltransferase [Rhodobacteraceae bacterium]|nr:16S rRNA (uracil(1498)-N(3))-methyltransferase [Paracoccaceae bacterium]
MTTRDNVAKIRLYLEASLSEGGEAALERDPANYLFNVMRLDVGDRLLAFNGRDGEWLAEVAAAGKRVGTLRLLERIRPPDLPLDLWLLFAPLKKARTDFIAEKACELGCRRVRPVFTRFTNSERVNVERLRAHAVEAAEQCGFVFVPEVDPPMNLDAVLDGWKPARRLYFCDETREARLLTEVASPGSAAILIGPEGGFSPEEAARLRSLDFVTPVALGPRVLRADTAAVAALTLWQATVGDWRDHVPE